MRKKVTITLDEGKEAVCLFNANYFYEHLLNITGFDLIGEEHNLTISKQLSLTPDMFYAGYLAECSMNKTEPVITREDFRHWFMSMDQDQTATILAVLTQARQIDVPERPGE